MVDLSSIRNFINPHTATHSTFLFKPKTTEKTPFSHIIPNTLTIVNKNLQDIHRTNIFHQSQDDETLEDNLGKRQAINLNENGDRIKYHDRSNVKATQGSIKISNTDGSHKREHDQIFFNQPLPAQTSFPQRISNNMPKNQIIVQHSINIVQPKSKGKKVPQNHDLPSAASTQSQGGGQHGNHKDFNHNNNNRDRFNLDYLDVDYVNRDMNVDLTTPSSQILTHMHQIHPTYIPRSTTYKVTTAKTISNPLLDPNFQPIGSSSGKRWSVKKRENAIGKGNDRQNKNNVLKASNFPDLPSLNPEKSSGTNLIHSSVSKFHFVFFASLFSLLSFQIKFCF